MSHSSEEKVTIREFLSEGLKLLALILIFGGAFLFISVLGCNHNACHVPESWTPVIEYFGR